MRPIVASALALGLVVLSAPAFGSANEFTNQGTTPQQQQQALKAAGVPDPNASTSSQSRSAQDSQDKGSSYGTGQGSGNMGGYSYSEKPAARASGGKKARAYKRTGPVVNLPGFEQTADGGSRLFVALSQPVPVEEHKAQGSITYVLKGASARVHNNTNALVTVHFNTPVSRARLVPHGKDLHFVIDLRAPATPTWKMAEAPDKTAVLQIDFPKGDYVKADGGEVPVSEASGEQGDQGGEGVAPATKAPPAKAGKKKGGKAAPAKPAPAPTGPTP